MENMRVRVAGSMEEIKAEGAEHCSGMGFGDRQGERQGKSIKVTI